LKINWIYIKGLVLLGVLTFLVGFSHSKNKVKNVEDVSIEFEEGNNLFMNYEMVNKLLIQNGKTVENEPKTVIDLQLLEANVLSHPMVESASVFLTIDGLLKTKIKQRTPVARVLSHNGSYYIDRQAKIMPLSENYSARVLIVSGDINDDDIGKIHFLATQILGYEFLKKQIIGVRKMKNSEFALRTRIGNQIIELGNLENLKLKFLNLESFYNKTMEDHTLEKYRSINLKYNNQVVCTKK